MRRPVRPLEERAGGQPCYAPTLRLLNFRKLKRRFNSKLSSMLSLVARLQGIASVGVLPEKESGGHLEQLDDEPCLPLMSMPPMF